MDMNRFIQVRRSRWDRLSSLLDQVDARGLMSLPADDIQELYSLYRLASSDLNWAQTQTGNPALLDYLESTVGRAYRLLASPQRARPWRAWWRIMRHDMPRLMRREMHLLMISTLAMLLGVVLGWTTTAIDPDLTRIFLPLEHLQQTPAQRVAQLEAQEMQVGGKNRPDDGGSFALFSSFLFSHNIRVAILAMALGMTFGIGTVVVLFFNGTLLGCIACDYYRHGVFEFFVAWVGPHGSIELPCIVFAGTAGLMLGKAMWRSDGRSAWHHLATQRQAVVKVLVATATLLVLAGIIEGGFSQINEPTLPYPLKIAVAGLLFAMLLGYLFLLPVREADRALISADEDENKNGG